VIGVVLSILMLKTLRLHTDNTQLMDKSLRLLLGGEWTHFGNAATKVGNIPGTFLTFITSLPMAFYFSAWSAAAMILFFHLGSYLFLRHSLLPIYEKNSVSLSNALVLLSVVYWLNPWRVEQVELYNPGFIFLFAAGHLYTSLKMTEKSFWLTLVHVLIVGFCFQVHFSFLILALISVFMYLRGQLKVSWTGFFAGTVLVALSLLPFLMTRFFSADVLQTQEMQNLDFTKSDAYFGRNFVLVYPVLKAIIYFFRMGSVYCGRHIFSEINFVWIENEALRIIFDFSFHGLKYVAAVATMWLSFKFIGGFLKNQYREKFWRLGTLKIEPRNRFNIYFIYLFIAAVVASGLSPVEFNHWHLVICFPAISCFMIITLLKYDRVVRHFQKLTVGLALVFTAWGFFAAGGSRSHEFSLNYQDQFYDHYKNQYEGLDDRLGRSIIWEKIKVQFIKNE
jgi:hypothetical protein